MPPKLPAASDGNCANSATSSAGAAWSTAAEATFDRMPRRKLRSQRDVVARTRELDEELRAALARPTDDADADAGIVDAVWHGEALGILLWALQLAELPAYDEPFDAERIAGAALGAARLRDEEEIEL